MEQKIPTNCKNFTNLILRLFFNFLFANKKIIPSSQLDYKFSINRSKFFKFWKHFFLLHGYDVKEAQMTFFSIFINRNTNDFKLKEVFGWAFSPKNCFKFSSKWLFFLNWIENVKEEKLSVLDLKWFWKSIWRYLWLNYKDFRK